MVDGISMLSQNTEGLKGWSLICNIDKRESIDLNISCIILSRSVLVCFTPKEKFRHLKWEVQTERREERRGGVCWKLKYFSEDFKYSCEYSLKLKCKEIQPSGQHITHKDCLNPPQTSSSWVEQAEILISTWKLI